MFQLKRILLTASILLCVLNNTHGADKYSHENRPYEFGFTIDGEQHRHEKKDEKGIIMGEYGFITADGVYHVTVYATDEFGHFKILSMKNIRVKPYPTAPSRQGHSISFPLSEHGPAGPAQSPSLALSPPHTQSPSVAVDPDQAPPIQEAHKFEPVKNEVPSKSCSHCSLPTTTTRAPPLALPASLPVSAPQYYIKPSATINAPGAGNPQYNQEALGPQTDYPNEQSKSQQNSIGSQQNNRGNTQQEFEQRVNLPQRLPIQQNNLQNSNIQNNPQQDLPKNLGSSPSYPDQERYNQVNNISDLGNHAQQGIVQNLERKQVDQKSNSNINSANGPEQLNEPLQKYPAQQEVSQNSPVDLNRSLSGQQLSQHVNGQKTAQQIGLQQEVAQNSPINLNRPDMGQQLSQQNVNAQQNIALQPNAGATSSIGGLSDTAKQNDPSQLNPVSGGTSRTAKQYEPLEETSAFKPEGKSLSSESPQVGLSKKPMLIAAQMQIVDRNTDIHHKRPGEQDGLPKGLTEDDMTHLLYTFNYTLAFQGHFEEGYTNGAKQGYYFVTGRNGVRTRVDYVADSKGFRPKISQEVLDLLSDDVPKPETEKDEKYGLKGYEFKWLYYPIESKV